MDLREASRVSGCEVSAGHPDQITEAPENCLLLDCILLLALPVTRQGRAFSVIGVTKGNLTVNSCVTGPMSNVLLFWCSTGLQ